MRDFLAEFPRIATVRALSLARSIQRACDVTFTQNDFPPTPLSREQIAVEMEKCGLKPTEQRVRIAEILMCAPQHMTAEQILSTVRASAAPISKATVYNTLNVLAERGLIRQIHLDPERSVFDSTRVPHHHFYDVETGELRDIAPDAIEFSRFPGLPEGTQAESVEVVIRVRKKRAGDGG